MDTHLRNPFADRFTVAEVPVFSRADTMKNTGAPHLVFQGSQPGIEFLGAQEDVHSSQYNCADAFAQLELMLSSESVYDKLCATWETRLKKTGG